MNKDDPAVFLKRSSPTPEGAQLTEQLDQHTGAPVPFWMFAEAMVHLRGALEWIAERTKVEALIRAAGRRSLIALAANIALVLGYAAHRLEANGAAEAHAADQAAAFLEYRDSVRREMDSMRHEISELRADLRRMSGADPGQGPHSEDSDGIWEKSASLMLNPEPIFAAGFPMQLKPGPKPDATCGALCDSNALCSSLPTTCKYCNGGFCSMIQFDPSPPTGDDVDAGVDAP